MTGCAAAGGYTRLGAVLDGVGVSYTEEAEVATMTRDEQGTDDRYLECVGCGWLLPMLHTPDDERCPECGGEFAVKGEDNRPQHLTALDKANAVRLARAALKRDVKLGRRSVADVVLEVPHGAETLELAELLMAQVRWGRARARRLLLSLGLPENKHVGTMTLRQASALAAVLREKGR